MGKPQKLMCIELINDSFESLTLPRYCYSGLRKKIITESPSLPSLKGGKGEVGPFVLFLSKSYIISAKLLR